MTESKKEFVNHLLAEQKDKLMNLGTAVRDLYADLVELIEALDDITEVVNVEEKE